MVYKVKLVSQTNAGVLLIILSILFMGGVRLFIPHGLHNKGLTYLVALVAFTITYCLWQKFVTGRTEWMIDKSHVTIRWTKKFAFTDNQETILKWPEIKKISRGPDILYYTLKIKLLNEQTIKYYHDTLTTRDDFYEMLLILYQTFNNNNAKSNKSISSSEV